MLSETRKEIAETVEKEYPLFDLFNMEYINLDESFFTPKGEDWLRDGKVYFKYDKSKIPEDKLNLICCNIMRNYFSDTSIQLNDEFCIMYDPEDKLANGMEDKEKGGISVFAIRRNGKIYHECGATASSILLYMSSLKHPKLEEAKEKVSKFAHECYDWIKEQPYNPISIIGIIQQ